MTAKAKPTGPRFPTLTGFCNPGNPDDSHARCGASWCRCPRPGCHEVADCGCPRWAYDPPESPTAGTRRAVRHLDTCPDREQIEVPTLGDRPDEIRTVPGLHPDEVQEA